MKNKKYIFYGLFFILLMVTTAFVYYKDAKKETTFLPLKERQGPLAKTKEWIETKATANALLQAINSNPKDIKSRLLMVKTYIEEGRITGDRGYYDNAALTGLQDVLTKEPDNFEGLCLQGTVQLSQHHFSDALATAHHALKLYDYNSFVYGLMVDADVELGHYEEAVKDADKMVSIRPDLTSYSRVSYLREIYGRTDGAIEAMKMAVEAGYPGLEQTSWCRVGLGKLYEQKGDLPNAQMQYEISLNQRPDYAYAIAGLARVEKYRKNYEKSLEYMTRADQLVVDYAFQEELAEIYKLTGEKQKADKCLKKAIAMLSVTSENDSKPGHGHYADRELAFLYTKAGDMDNALKHALIEYNRRPDNNDVNEMMAWVKYKRGEYKEADDYIKAAMKTKSQNSVLLCRAGLIKMKTGQKEYGLSLVKEAMKINPYLPNELTIEAQPFLAMK